MLDSVKDAIIRVFASADESTVIDLWHACGLVASQNDPRRDLETKINFQPELFWVAEISGQVVGTIMAGYEGHRGWINYLAVDPSRRRQGLGRRLMEHAETRLRELGCPKINLQVRSSNTQVIAFYQALGFVEDDVVSLGKRVGQHLP